MMRILQSEQIGDLLTRRAVRMTEAEETVRPILEDVRKRGDEAVLAYAKKFDGFAGKQLAVPVKDLDSAAKRLSKEFRAAVHVASENIRSFAKFQYPKENVRNFGNGLRIGQIVRPLDTVAAYVPGGRYPLPSTVMMTVIPAQVAGVKNICVTTPKAVDEIYGTARELGVEKVFRIGGAHAIAAFAYGTGSIPRADRIVGPGNIYVAAAKKILAGEVAIEFVAGPTEILIISKDGEPRHLASDMLAQAEHDVDASAVLLTPSRYLAEQVAGEIERQLGDLPTAAVARVALERNSAIVLVETMDEAVELSNRFAPEHLSVPDTSYLAKISNAGSVFIGHFTPEAAGDYASGPNHVLPTGGAARARGGLSVMDYLKIITVQELTPAALSQLAETITTLARAEGLEAHARSVEVRLHGQR